MLDVVTARVRGTLHSDQVLVISFATLKHEPVEPRVSLVLVALGKVPSQHKVLRNVVNARTNDCHGHVVPGHAAVVSFAKLVLLPVSDFVEVHDAVVVEVLARPNLFSNAFRMAIGKRMMACVPSAKAEIQSTDECNRIVNDNELFVMRPVHGHIGRVFKDVVIGVSHDANVFVARRTFRAQSLKGMLGVYGVTSEGGLDFLVDHDVDLDAGLGLALQNLVQAELLVVMRRSTKEQLGREPPVGNVDALLGIFESNGDGPEVVESVYVPLDMVALAFWEV